MKLIMINQRTHLEANKQNKSYKTLISLDFICASTFKHTQSVIEASIISQIQTGKTLQSTGNLQKTTMAASLGAKQTCDCLLFIHVTNVGY